MQNVFGIKGKLSVVLLTAMVLTSGLAMLLEPTNQTGTSEEVSTIQALGEEQDHPGTFVSDEHTVFLYHFDETDGTIAEDETESYDGTVFGNAEWVPGRWGNALKFDGIDDYVDTDWYPHIAPEDDFSIEFWLKTNNTERYYGMPLFGVNDDTYNHHPRIWGSMVSRAHNEYPLVYAEYSDETNYVKTVRAREIIDDYKWHYFAFVRESGVLSLYIDGIIYDSVVDHCDDDYYADYSFLIGDERFYPVTNYEGLMDEFRVSNVARNIQPLIGVKTNKETYAPGEEVLVTADYFESSSDLSIEVFSPDNELIHTISDHTIWGSPYEPDENTVALYHLDEADKVTDFSGNGNDGTIYGTSSIPGQLDCALDFDGTDDYVAVPHDETLNFGDGDFTVEMWVNSSISTSKYDPLVIKYPGAYGDPACFLTQIGDYSLRTGMFEIIIRNSQNVYVFIQSTTPVNDGIWHHCAAVREGDELRIYVDGRLENSTDCSIVGDISNSAPLWMGKRITHSQFYDGSLDEVRLSNVARDVMEFNVRHYHQTEFKLPVDAVHGEYSVIASDPIHQINTSVTFDVGGHPLICDLAVDDGDISLSNNEPYAYEPVSINAIVHDNTWTQPSLDLVWERYIREVEDWSVAYPTNIALQSDDELLVFHFTRYSNKGLITNIDPEDGELNWMRTKVLSSKLVFGANVDANENIYVGNAWSGYTIWKMDPDFEDELASHRFSSSGFEYVSGINPTDEYIYATGYRGSGYGGGSALAKLDYSLNLEWEVNVRHSENGAAWNQYFITEPVGESVWRAGRDRSNPDTVRIIEHAASNGTVLKDISWPTTISNVNYEYMPGFVYSEEDDMFILSRIANSSDAIINGIDTDGNVMWETVIPDHQVAYTAVSNNVLELGNGYYLVGLEDSDKKTVMVIIDDQGSIALMRTITGNNTYRTKAMCLGNDGAIFVAQEGYDLLSNRWDENDVRVLKIAYGQANIIEQDFKTVRLGAISDGEHDNAQGIVSGDINDDGRMDIVAATYNSGNQIHILENDGSVDNPWESHLVGTANGYVNGLELADFDGDGDLDILSCDWGGGLLLWNNTNKTTMAFTGPYSIGGSRYIANIAINDLDNDGDMDIISTFYSDTIMVWENPGSPFTTWNGWIANVTDTATRSIIPTDLDNDNKTDLVVGHTWRQGKVTIWKYDTTPWGEWSYYTVFDDDRIENIAVADLDDDGYNDIIAPEHSDNGYVHIWKNNGNPFDDPWSMVTIGSTGFKTDGILVADFDDDGTLDILTGDYSTSLNLWRSTGDPFSDSWTPTEYNTDIGAGVVTMALSDINDDEVPDAVIRCFGQNLCVYGFTVESDILEEIEATVEFRVGSETGILIHSEDVSIPVGEQVEVSTTWTPTIHGEYEIFVNVTDVEPTDRDLSNNIASKTLNVMERPPFWIVDDDEGRWAHFNIIQEAVDFAIDGEMIWVYSGEYHENIVMDKQLKLYGNGSNETVIDGDEKGTALSINADGCSIDGFTLTNAGPLSGNHGLDIHTDSNEVYNCTISKGHNGVVIQNNGRYNLIAYCTIENNYWHGLIFHPGIDNTVRDNLFRENGLWGIACTHNSYGNQIHHNMFIDNYGFVTQCIDNGNNSWDDGSEGNFWSDYTGPDEDGDGIGDIPYDLEGDGDRSDRYPLMGYGSYSFKTVEYRIAGKPGNVVNLSVTLNDVETDVTSLTRTKGAPNETTFRFYIDSEATINLTFQFHAAEGNVDTPVWLIIDGKKEKVTTFEATDDPDTWYQEYQLSSGLVEELLS